MGGGGGLWLLLGSLALAQSPCEGLPPVQWAQCLAPGLTDQARGTGQGAAPGALLP